MMSEMGLVREGHIFEDSAEVESLHQEISDLKRELSEARREAATAKRQAERATAELRRQLQPLYRALQNVFGELDEIGGDDSSGPSDPRVSKVWENWKSKMGTAAKIIDALQLHGDLNTQQLAVAVGLHRTTIPALIHKLNKAGLINKNGGRFSLKQL